MSDMPFQTLESGTAMRVVMIQFFLFFRGGRTGNWYCMIALTYCCLGIRFDKELGDGVGEDLQLDVESLEVTREMIHWTHDGVLGAACGKREGVQHFDDSTAFRDRRLSQSSRGS